MIPEKFSDGGTVKILIPFEEKINALIDEINKIKNAKTNKNVKWLYSDKNLLIAVSGSGESSGESLPTGSTGDMLYNLSGSWVVLNNPSGSSGYGTGNTILYHKNNIPIWQTGSFASDAGHPFRLTGVVNTSASLFVQAGTVNNAVPKIGSTSLAAFPRPHIVVTGTNGQVWIKATVDSLGTLTDVAVEEGSSMPSDTSTLKYKLIGSWTRTGDSFTSVISFLRNSQTLFLCNGTALWEAT